MGVGYNEQDFFLTRTWRSKTGGGIVRCNQVKYLRKMGWEVIVVTPFSLYNKEVKSERSEEGIVWIPNKIPAKLGKLLERTGILDDYLDNWVKNSFNYLKKIIKSDDILIATTGGELGTLKLAHKLKSKINCKYLINYHDPIDFTKINEKVIPHKGYYILRDSKEEKYLRNVDYVVTMSEGLKNVLLSKYSFLKSKITEIYFGFSQNKKKSSNLKLTNSKKINIVYGGSFESYLRKPELILNSLKFLEEKYIDKIEVTYIGNWRNYKPIVNFTKSELGKKTVTLLPYMSNNEFIEYIVENADLGLVSLGNDYYARIAMPSKIYDYISLGIPMLGLLPSSSAMDIINKNKYGKALYFNNHIGVAKYLERIINYPQILKEYKSNILSDRDSWEMEYRMEKLDSILKNI